MSRTGNQLFPDDPGDGWVTAVIKALPQDKPAPDPRLDEALKTVPPEALHMVDPVGIEADSKFSTVAAETAQRDAIFAAGWSAQTTGPQAGAPPAPDAGAFSPQALDALDAVISRESDAAGFAAVDDPVAVQADSVFAGIAAETATRQAIEAAGWKAGATAAKAEPPDAELQALDQIAADPVHAPDFAPIDDPVALSADARFAEAEAAGAQRDAMLAAGWKADALTPKEQLAVPPPSPDEIEDLDRLADAAAQNADFARIDNPVAYSADARFAEAAAQAAARDAMLAARAFDDKALAAEAVTAVEETKALDALAARLDPEAASPAEDAVAAAAEARFAEIAADVATRDAIRAARLEDAKAAAGPMPPPADVRALDALAARNELAAASPIDDPVALEAAARFAERAADLAIADALFAAGWQPNALAADTQVAKFMRRRRELESLEIEDLVRAEAEIAFEDAAYDLAYARVGSLATGEAAALAAFDQAIAAGLDPEDALQLAIAAAEELDPRVFGGLARVATLPGDFELIGPVPRASVVEQMLAELTQPAPEAQLRDQPVITISELGSGFRAITGQPLILGATGSDTLNVPGFKFVFDPAVISAPGSGFHFVEHEDLILIPRAAARIESKGSAADDLIVGSDGNDAVAGLAGDDYLYGDRPTNYVAGTHDAANPLADPIFPSSGGDDLISGGEGDDTLWGGAGNAVLDGDVTTEAGLSGEFSFSLGGASTGNDVIYGGDGDDTQWGGGGNDVLYGGSGNDNIFGYTGDDILVGGAGIDVLTGGTGADEFRFQGGSGATSLARAQSLGTDAVEDFSEADGDTFGLSDADFGFGAAGTLTDGADYFEHAPATLSAAPLDASSGAAGPAIVVFGDASGADGVSVYYTDDASAMTADNSYQIADVRNANLAQIDAGDFNLRA